MVLPKIIFIIGMHRCGTSLLSNCLVQNGFTIGKTKNQDKNWQNPNGYCENDAFTEMHNTLLSYNSSSWHTITKKKMNYTPRHIQHYKNLLQTEFVKDQFILIKDPRLTFFVDFLKEVCRERYKPYFIFLTRNKEECCQSLSKAQNISYKKCEILYDITTSFGRRSDEFLKIVHHDIIYHNKLVLSNISNYIGIDLKINTENLVEMKLYRNRAN